MELLPEKHRSSHQGNIDGGKTTGAMKTEAKEHVATCVENGMSREDAMELLPEKHRISHQGNIDGGETTGAKQVKDGTGAMNFASRSKGGRNAGKAARPTKEVFVARLFEVFTPEQIRENNSRSKMTALIKTSSDFQYKMCKVAGIWPGESGLIKQKLAEMDK